MWLLALWVTNGHAAKVMETVEWSTVRLVAHSSKVAKAARETVEDGIPEPWRDDCSGFVSAVYTAAGIPMEGRVATLWDAAEARGALHFDPIPRIGDLAFFDDTWDRDGDGQWNDPRTHIAVVVDVKPDGTVVLAHKGTSGRALIRMNLLDPNDRSRNSNLRPDGGGPFGLTTTGELWSGFATVDPSRDWRTE